MLWVFRKIFKWYKYNIKKDQKKNIYKICNNPTKHLKYDVHTVLTNILLFGKKKPNSTIYNISQNVTSQGHIHKNKC